MRSIVILVLIWLAVQVGGMLFEARQARSPAKRPPALSGEDVEKVLRGWPDRSRTAAHSIISKCGLPDGARANLLSWRDEGIVLYCDTARAVSSSYAAGTLKPDRATALKRNRAKLLRAGS